MIVGNNKKATPSRFVDLIDQGAKSPKKRVDNLNHKNLNLQPKLLKTAIISSEKEIDDI